MNTWMPARPRIAYSAALPVSPEVAPRMFSSLFCSRSTCSKSAPSSCMATSLNASVGPLDSFSSARPGSSGASGVISSLPNTSAV